VPLIPSYQQFGCDIVKFNAYVKDLMDLLTAMGETTQNLLAVVKAYKAVNDQDFVTYIRKKEDEYEEEGTIDIDFLMLQASNKKVHGPRLEHGMPYHWKMRRSWPGSQSSTQEEAKEAN